MALSEMYNLPAHVQKEIINMCVNEFKTAVEIGKALNLKSVDIRDFLYKEGYSLKKIQQQHFQDLAKSAADEHISGQLLSVVAKKYGISTTTIENYMKRNGIVYRNQHGRKNFFNQRFFQSIDSEASAYFLGFLFADGHIGSIGGSTYTKPCRIIINISQKDRCILEQFMQAIQASGNVHIHDYIPHETTYANHPMSRITLNSTKMAEDLMDLKYAGVKADRSELPNIPKEYIRHFIRGYFEGDGCATTDTIQFTGYTLLLNNIAALLNHEINLPLTKVALNYTEKSTANIGDLRYHKYYDRSKLYHYMYDDVQYYLPRKKDQIIKHLT